MTKRHADATIPGLPSNATYDADGYIVKNAAGNFQIDNDDANIAHTILKHSNVQMITGDELGTYRVESSAPGPVASDWTAIDGASGNEYMFQDTIMNYNASATPGTESNEVRTNYKLWLKTSFTFAGSVSSALMTEPFGWDTGEGGSLKQKPITQADNLVQDILYPIYVQPQLAGESGYGYPIYEWSTSNSVSAWEEIRGTVADTYFTHSNLRSSYIVGGPPGGTYYADRWGTGTLDTVNWFFKLSFPSTDYIRTLT